MCKAILAPTESKEEEDRANPPSSSSHLDSKTLNLSQLFDCGEETSTFDDAPMPLSVAPPSGEGDLFSPCQSTSKCSSPSRDSWQVSDEKPQVWDLEPDHTEDQNWLYFSDHIEPSKNEDRSWVGAGLSNLGNTCFMNAILQCFTHTVPLIKGFRSSSHSFPCDRYNNEFCVICALRAQIEHSLASTGGIVSPWKLVKNLSYFSSSFQRYQQEDAHEFMQYALDKLDRCFLYLKENNKSFEDVNLVEKIFGGRLISKLRCSNCGHTSNTYEPLIDMSLEIENVDTLPSALQSFTKLEYIESNFKCDGCKEEVYLEKQLLLDQAPLVAAFHLKRFKTDGTFVEKLDKHVDFPLELDLQLCSVSDQNSNEPMKYDLYAVVVHVGLSATSGHYFCYVRSAPDIWHKLNDSQVSRVSADSVLSQEAYILFYAQQGTPWFSSIMESPMPCLDPSIWNTSPKSVLRRVDSSDKSSPSITANILSDEASDSNEFSKKQLDYSCKVMLELPKVNDTIDASHGCKQFLSKPKQESVGLNSVKDTIQAQVPLEKGAMLIVSALVVGDSQVESGDPDKNKCSQQVVDFGKNNDTFNHLIPPSSPCHVSPDRSYHIRQDHLKKNSGSGKKTRSKYVKDEGNSERKAALRYASKMHGSRRDAILALVGCNGEALKKKRKVVDSSLCKEDSHNHASVMRPVAAGKNSS